MARPLKIVLWIAGGFLALVAVAAIALPLLFDPNDHKERIAAEVRKATGRELTIEGDIELTLFPWLGASVAGVTLGNAPGFGPEPFAKVAEMNVGVRLMPLLLDRQVQVGTVRIDGLALNLAKAADGTNNWADLARGQDEKPATPETEAPREPGAGVGSP
jgi:AsmA protein